MQTDNGKDHEREVKVNGELNPISVLLVGDGGRSIKSMIVLYY